MDREDRVEIVALPLHTGLIVVAAGFHGDESCFQKIADAFQHSIFGQASVSSDGVVTGMTGVCFAILNQQQNAEGGRFSRKSSFGSVKKFL